MDIVLIIVVLSPGLSNAYFKSLGTDNLFMLFASLEGWRHIKVTDRHTAMGLQIGPHLANAVMYVPFKGGQPANPSAYPRMGDAGRDCPGQPA